VDTLDQSLDYKKKKGDMAKGNKFANPYKGLVVVYRIAYDLSR